MTFYARFPDYSSSLTQVCSRYFQCAKMQDAISNVEIQLLGYQCLSSRHICYYVYSACKSDTDVDAVLAFTRSSWVVRKVRRQSQHYVFQRKLRPETYFMINFNEYEI